MPWSPAHCREKESGLDLATPLLAMGSADLCWAWVGASVNDSMHVGCIAPISSQLKEDLASHPEIPSTLPLLGSCVDKLPLRANVVAVRAWDLGKTWGNFGIYSCDMSCASGKKGQGLCHRLLNCGHVFMRCSHQPPSDRQHIIVAQAPCVQFRTETVLVS